MPLWGSRISATPEPKMLTGDRAKISELRTRHSKIFKGCLSTDSRQEGVAEAQKTSSYPIFYEQAESWGNPKDPPEPISWEVLGLGRAFCMKLPRQAVIRLKAAGTENVCQTGKPVRLVLNNSRSSKRWVIMGTEKEGKNKL